MYPVKLHLFTLQNLCFTRLHRWPVIERTSGGSVTCHTSGLGDKLLASSSFCLSVMIQTPFLSSCRATSVSGRLCRERIKQSSSDAARFTLPHQMRSAGELWTQCVCNYITGRLTRTVSWQLFHTIPNQPLASRSIHRDCLVAHGTLNKGHWQDISLHSCFHALILYLKKG